MEAFAVAVLAANFLAINRDFLDIALIYIGHELCPVSLCILLAATAVLDHLPQQEGRQHDDQPEHYCLNRRIHWDSSKPLRENTQAHLIRCRTGLSGIMPRCVPGSTFFLRAGWAPGRGKRFRWSK